MEDYMQYYWGNYMSRGQRVPLGGGGLNYEAYRAHYWPAYMDYRDALVPPGTLAPAPAPLEPNFRPRVNNEPGDGAYIGSFRIPAPDGEYVERISTTLENRVRLQELAEQPRLTILEAHEVSRFVESQYHPPDRVILKTIWLLAGKVDKADRRAIRGSEWPDRGDLESLVPFHNPMGIFAWPPKFLWHIFRSLDWADYQALASRDNITTIMRTNGRIGLPNFPPQLEDAPAPPVPVAHALQAAADPAGAAPELPPGAAPAPLLVAGAQANMNVGAVGGARARPPPVNNDPMNPLRGERGPYVRRRPVGATADILRAGPRPGAAWSILTCVAFAGLFILLLHNMYTYARLKITQRNFENQNNLYLGPGPFFVNSCYSQCVALAQPSPNYVQAWTEYAYVWFFGSVGMMPPS